MILKVTDETSTVGYPSDSWASCLLFSDGVVTLLTTVKFKLRDVTVAEFNYYAAVLKHHITSLARSFVRPSILYGFLTRKQNN